MTLEPLLWRLGMTLEPLLWTNALHRADVSWNTSELSRQEVIDVLHQTRGSATAASAPPAIGLVYAVSVSYLTLIISLLSMLYTYALDAVQGYLAHKKQPSPLGPT
jgi:hypothetical protein